MGGEVINSELIAGSGNSGSNIGISNGIHSNTVEFCTGVQVPELKGYDKFNQSYPWLFAIISAVISDESKRESYRFSKP